MTDETVKIKNLVKNAMKFEDMQFRLLFEELVKQGGREAEHLVNELVLASVIPEPVRINIIRSMGYILSSTFLISLRKILESDENIRLRKAAIISISKFNDKRALNMLNSALNQIDNPILQDSISTEISRIKKDNPILSLMPKFLNGVNDPKTFRTTLEILKQILNPDDAQVFIYHLNSEVPFVGDGAFEVLCWRGNESVQFSIFDFFRKKLKAIECFKESECIPLQDLLNKMEKFVTRNSQTINYILKELKDIYKITQDNAVKDLIINMFASSHKREVLSFLEDVYNSEYNRKEMIIEKLVGNEDGVYILIYKFKNDPAYKEKLLLGLCTTQAGADFIFEGFEKMDPKYQQLVWTNINPSNYHYFTKLIEQFLLSPDYTRKKYALDQIKNNQDSSFRDILLDPKRESEFIRMHAEYIETISMLFSIPAFKFFINRMMNHENSRLLIRKYLEQRNMLIYAEPIIVLSDEDSFSDFADKLSKFNHKELNLAVLDIFYCLKTFDYKSFQKIQIFLEEFKTLRGVRLTPDEKGVLNKIQANLLNVNSDLKVIENGNTNINHFIEKTFPDYDLLDYILKNHYLSFFIQREKVIDRIRRVFKLTNEIDAFDTIKFFLRRPSFCIYFRDEIQQCTKSSNYLLKNDADKLLEIMPQDMRFVLLFENENRKYYAGIKDQFMELLPDYPVYDGQKMEILSSDILITDTPSVKKLVSENRLNTKKLFVILKDKDEFISIRELNPKVFPPPFSLYKMIKAVLPDIFQLEETEKKG